jgi:hypothetical protein
MFAPPEIDGFGQYGQMHTYPLHLIYYTIDLHSFQAETTLLTVELFLLLLGNLHTIQIEPVHVCRINPDKKRMTA